MSSGTRNDEQKKYYFNNLKNRLSTWNATFDDSEIEWKGVKARYIVICSNGHRRYMTGITINKGSKCQKCHLDNLHTNDTLNAEKRFRQYLINQNAIPIWTEWKGMFKPHAIICPNGHIATPYPINASKTNRGICNICSGKSPEESERKCIRVLSEFGAIPLWDMWNGVHKTHKIQCINGHINDIYPGSIINGRSPCFCHSRIWDIFYVVYNSTNNSFKFGITSNKPNDRIRIHRSNGYSKIIYLVTNINAKFLEDQIKILLKDNDYQPIYGCEYFSDDALPLIINELNEYGLENIVESDN